MAVPTISGVDPTSGPTKGTNVVKISGTGFRLPPTPPPGPVGGAAQRTVSVQFDGRESDWAHAITDSLIYARVPEWRGPADATMPVALDVRVANLDDSGVEIPGENVTAAGAYSVDRPKLSVQTDFQNVIRELIDLIRRHVVPNVWLTISAEYDDTYADGLDIPKQADLPVIHLAGPATPENRFYSLNRLDPEEDPADADAWIQKKEPVTVDLDFEIIGWADHPDHLYGMGQALSLLFRDHKWLYVPIDPNDPAQGEKRYELDQGKDFGGQPEYDTPPAVDNLRNFRASCTIRGVDIDERDGIIIRRGWNAYVDSGYVLDIQSI